MASREWGSSHRRPRSWGDGDCGGAGQSRHDLCREHDHLEIDGRAGKHLLDSKARREATTISAFGSVAENPQIIALSSDQGAEISVNGGATWSSWYNQPTAQFYHVTTDNRFPYWVYGAQQESGSVATRAAVITAKLRFASGACRACSSTATSRWIRWIRTLFTARKLTRTSQDIGEVADIAPEPVRRGEYRYDRTLPVVFSPLDPHALYFAANVLFKRLIGEIVGR